MGTLEINMSPNGTNSRISTPDNLRLTAQAILNLPEGTEFNTLYDERGFYTGNVTTEIPFGESGEKISILAKSDQIIARFPQKLAP